MAFIEPKDPGALAALASSLCQSLQRELVHVAGGRVKSGVKDVYDAVYLPRLVALSHEADRYVESEDWQLLCQPLHPDLADAQLGIVLELLRSLVMAF